MEEFRKPGATNVKNSSPKIKNDERLPQKVKDRLNFHINAEMEASQIYRSMATWCEFNGLFKAASYFNRHAEEELTHMTKLQKYILDRNCKPEMPEVKRPVSEFKNLVDVVRKAHEHEVYVSNLYEETAEMVLKIPCHTTYAFLHWFLKEQVEEESTFKNLLDKVEMMEKEGVGILEIESEISSGSLIG